MMRLILVAVFFAITIGTSFQFGYHTGLTNQPLELLINFIGNVTVERHGSTDGVHITLLGSLCVVGFTIGGLVGGLVGGYLANRLGRRNSIFVLAAPCLLGCVLMTTSKVARAFEMIIVGRVLVGFACGAYTAIGPAYLSEVAPPEIRGAAGVLNQLMVVFAIVLVQVLGLKEALCTEELWPYLFGLNAIPCVISIACLLFCPESPRYLYLTRNNEEAARKALLRLGRKPDEIKAELNEMHEETQNVTQKIALLSFFRVRHLRWGLLIALVCQMGQQLCGINGLLYYSAELFKSTGLSSQDANYATIGIGCVFFVVTLISVFIIDRVGRRVLLIGGLLTIFVCLVVYTICLVIRTYAGVNWPAYVAIASTYIFIVGFGIGPGSIPWFIVAEMFTQETRDVAISLAVLVNWLCNIVVGLIFLELVKSIGIYAFLPFLVILLGVIPFLYFFLPETKGRSSAEVEGELSRPVIRGRPKSQNSELGNVSGSTAGLQPSSNGVQHVYFESKPVQ
ncbi:Solute carrier family 2 facilitated glucose transporter member 3 [Fasciola hepatica]|uniref:Solute carrier family 2 facilitated glucose transporter member 3 n=1 Tax=Fasciola hepatica TaxID=6192 RepID=A0A4E0S1L1_FASHE|nr:Solute carrier family 2 facilitated glucose transporter member 3 [Fasciola hepatica]